MKTNAFNLLQHATKAALLLTICLLGGCHESQPASSDAKLAAAPESRPASLTQPLDLALVPHSGDGKLDAQIRHFQDQVRSNIQTHASLERLGWLYVGKARESFDPGFYTLAEQCALALENRQPGCAEALLLRGHTLHSQHRFSEAEPLARELVSRRGLAADHGLLGDILLDVGRLEDAAAAYQAMLDLKPDPQGYARAAQLRWLKGDLDGALEVMRLAVTGVSARDAESAAWMHTQFARYLWQAGRIDEAAAGVEDALSLRANFAPALLLRGRLLLSAGKSSDAIHWLQSAVQFNPLPEYQWTLAEALRMAGRDADAADLEQLIATKGPASDPRGCALFLATRGIQPTLAMRLARKELAERQDVFSHDALAWALAAAGDLNSALKNLRSALAEGTRDARLWLHAGIIHCRAGDNEAAGRWLSLADSVRDQLLPSEQALLRQSMQQQTKLSNSLPAPSKSFPTAAVSGAASEN